MTHERPGSNSTFEASTIPHRTTGLSPLSTDLEEDSAWESLKVEAKVPIEEYVITGDKARPREDILKNSLHALLDWLLWGGCDSYPRSILKAKSDRALWDHFWVVCCFLAAPSK
ncbi:hypothetical protein PEX2_027900 [Penicillium expansum]|uniref:Uncharacterized protein n=1 Tax=Penicillium expansum TaxID=27334 RepID=A0A0A2JD40_PENEN|nr:hypothetical protein PEX2_027900 [Penicillium expansum]KGO50225.1 hypothetical protein PEX2_027900 [Penicillium expansum]